MNIYFRNKLVLDILRVNELEKKIINYSYHTIQNRNSTQQLCGVIQINT